MISVRVATREKRGRDAKRARIILKVGGTPYHLTALEAIRLASKLVRAVARARSWSFVGWMFRP